jgi:hypothetical protein
MGGSSSINGQALVWPSDRVLEVCACACVCACVCVCVDVLKCIRV